MSDVNFSLLPLQPAGIASPGAEPPAIGGLYKFRRFQVDIGSRLLKCDATPVELGGRAFDLLVLLLQNSGTVVSKRQIMEAVWPSTVVDESNLRFQMACLRRVLGRDGDLIKTIQGCGYLFVAEVVCVSEDRRYSRSPTLPARRPLAPNRNGPPTVAVIDDDESTRNALDGLLRSSGYLVETYPSPQAYMDVLRSNAAECLVLDVWLPGRNGLDVQADLRALGSDVPIVFISGHADISMSVRAMKGGAVEFLTKPVRHEELLNAISLAVDAVP